MCWYIFAFIAGVLTSSILIILMKLFKSEKANNLSCGDSLQQLQQLSRLTGSLAHEIKNPLSIIKVNMKLLGENLDYEEFDRAKRKIEVLKNETSRLEDILENFLRFIGRPELEKNQVDINKMLDEIVEFFSPQAWKNAVKLRFMPSDTPILCMIDSGKIRQVILNLLINAQKALENSGEIIILTSIEQNSAKICINDTGKGIEPERIDKIFDAFYTAGSGGSGLGLATAKKIVEAHNGKITVKSETGNGSSFIILLPLI